MGGLLRKMPKTGAAFAVGCAAVVALPPLNGFFSEWVVYLGLFRAFSGPGEALLAGFAAPALALAGGVALAAFVKLFGIVFLGNAALGEGGPRPRAGPGDARADPSPRRRLPRGGPPLPAPRPRARRGDARAWARASPGGAMPLADAAPLADVATWGAAFLALVLLAAGATGVPPPPALPLARPDVGLRLREADVADAVHGELLRRVDRRRA